MKSTIKLKIILGFLVITGCTGINNKTTVNGNIKDMIATVSMSTKPVNDTGVDLEKNLRATFSGNVYNEKGESVEYALVKAKALDEGITWVAEYQLTAGGAFVIRNSPVGAKIEITVSKDGVSKSKIVNIKPNLYGDPNFNKFDFGHSANDKNSTNNDFLKVNALSENKDPLAADFPSNNLSASASPIPYYMQIRGKVYNEKGELVSNAFIKMKELDSVNSNCSFFEETFSEFIFNPLNIDKKIRITASKNGVSKYKDIFFNSELIKKDPNIFDFGHSANDKNSTNNDFLNVPAKGKNTENIPVLTIIPNTEIQNIKVTNESLECIIPIPIATPTPES